MDDSTECWLPVPGWEGLYEVSDLGRVRSLPRRGTHKNRLYGGKLLKPSVNAYGYYVVGLCRDRTMLLRFVHRLVLSAFAGPCPDGMEARHGPGGSLDNRLANLCWGTPSDNQMDRVRDGTTNRGERSANAKLTQEIVEECRRRFAAGESQSALAREFGVVVSTMHEAIRGITWTATS